MGVQAAIIAFSCSSCGLRLRLPTEAAGRRARCGSCKGIVRVPAATPVAQTPRPAVVSAVGPAGGVRDVEDELGSFLSEMISEDREFEPTDGFAPPKRFQRAARRPREDVDEELDEPTQAEAEELRQKEAARAAAKASGPAAAAAKPAAPVVAAPKPEPRAAPAPAPAPGPIASPAAPEPAAATVAASASAAPGFPVHTPGAFLSVRSISALGIRLAFPAQQLQDPRFRASFPAVCVFSGKPITRGGYARPMVFNNHHGEGDERVRMVELRHEKTILQQYSAKAFVEETARMEELPDPFDLAMPYPVSAGHHESSLRCEAHVSARHGGYCEVVIPSPEAALAWVGAVNGVCHETHRQLCDKGSKVSSEAWTRLPQAVRERIGMWCTFRRGEHFLAYARDSHSQPKDAGLGGILVTNQRLVFHLYRTTWSMDLRQPLKVYCRLRDETFGLAARQGEEELRPMCSLLRGDAALLFEALEDAAADLTVVPEEANLATAA